MGTHLSWKVWHSCISRNGTCCHGNTLFARFSPCVCSWLRSCLQTRAAFISDQALSVIQPVLRLTPAHFPLCSLSCCALRGKDSHPARETCPARCPGSRWGSARSCCSPGPSPSQVSLTISLCLGGCSKTPQTGGWGGGLINRNLFHMVLEEGRPRSWCQGHQALVPASSGS